MANTRVHVVIPKELTDEIDASVGPRNRSSFICEAAREKLTRLKQIEAIRKFAGSLGDRSHPEWEYGSAEWVHNLRQADEKNQPKFRHSSSESSHRHQHRHRRTQEKMRAR